MQRARVLWRSVAQLRAASEDRSLCPTEVQRVVEETNVTTLPVHDAAFLFKSCVDSNVPRDSEVGPIFQMYFLDNAAQIHAHQFETFLQGLARFGQLRSAFEEPHVIELLPFIAALSPNQLFGCARALAFADVNLPVKFYRKATERVLHAWRKGRIRCDLNERVHLLSLIDASQQAPVHWREVWALGRRLQKDNAWEDFAPQLPTTYVLRLLQVFHRVALEKEEMLNERLVFDPLRRLGLEACERGTLTPSEQAGIAEAVGFWGGFFPYTPSVLSPEVATRHRLSLLWAPLVRGPGVDSKWRTAASALLADNLSSVMSSARRNLMLRQVRQELGDAPVGHAAWSKQKRTANRQIERSVRRSNMDAVMQTWSFWSKARCFLGGKDYAPLDVDSMQAEVPGLTGFELVEARHLHAEHRKVMLIRSDATLKTIRSVRDSNILI
eukprot:GEMP01058425.1.p1 GENE.GEMP01058425.1~~GEMP01058425.1.p1  ORF type:complete len:440 (+),score=101.95 GEMP01058425.1:120-1439(+)